ncbi:hypothetical protein HYX17_05300 [Candidatus Woesearchaeota archaeon]|nr:hypothetical protein [Candidatus Woesearchaeota archaeon]
MIREYYKLIKEVSDYKVEWDSELERILRYSDPVIRETIGSKAKNRKNLSAYCGAIVPRFLDIINAKIDPNNAHFMNSAFILAVGLFDDSTERLELSDKLQEFDWFESLLLGNGNGDILKKDRLYSEKKSIFHLINYVIHYLKDEYKQDFFNSVAIHKNAVYLDDIKTEPNLEIRANVGRTFADLSWLLIQSRLNIDISRYKPLFSQLHAGGAIMDDMIDVSEDYGVRVTKPLIIINGKKPNPSNIILSGMIKETFKDADKEFFKALNTCDTEFIKDNYIRTIQVLKLVCAINVFRKYIQHNYGVYV